MAEKLIDAEAVFKKISGVSTTLHPNTLSAARVGEVLESMTAFLDSQPDASEPLRAELEAKDARIKELEEQTDSAYLERNTCVATMARMALMLGFKAVRTRTAIEGWSEDWHGCVYIEFPNFQTSWHFHDSQAHLFEFLPEEGNQWDGHTTDEKYQNLRDWSKGGQDA